MIFYDFPFGITINLQVAPRVSHTWEIPNLSQIRIFDDFTDFNPRNHARSLCRAQKRCLGMFSDETDNRLPAQLPLTAENHRFLSKSDSVPARPGIWLYKDFNGKSGASSRQKYRDFPPRSSSAIKIRSETFLII